MQWFNLNSLSFDDISATTGEYNSFFCEISDGREVLKGIYFFRQRFAGNDFRAFLAGKQIIKLGNNNASL